MKIFGLIIFWAALLSMVAFAYKYPKGEFVSPVNRQMRLSGTFGELRTNHFHAGLDIKSLYQVSGDPIYATGEGYISRIKEIGRASCRQRTEDGRMATEVQ